MANFLTDNEDLQWYLTHGIDWAPLVDVLEPGFADVDGPKSLQEAVDSYRDILSMVGEFIAEQMAPQAAAIDKTGLHLVDGEVREPEQLKTIFDGVKELGLHGMVLPRELGGMNMPIINYLIAAEMIARADVSMMTHNSFHSAMALAMMLYSIDEGTTHFDERGRIKKTRFAAEIKEIIDGEAWGSMDITEPDAGSDMAALNSRGEQNEKGEWLVTGQKIFITSGHAKYHFVIARTEALDKAPGLKGLSLFLVKSFDRLPDGSTRRYVTIDRIEEKIGHHASATCSVIYEKSPAQLIGKRGEGFRGMLLLMNNARLGVGFEGLGICEAAYRLARDYAAQRKSMGKTIDQHELIADYLDEMRTDIQGIRAIAMWGAQAEELAQRLGTAERWQRDEAGLAKRQSMLKEAKRKSRRVTPLLKYLSAEKAVAMSRMCMQIHGGVGYTQEYGAEKLLRDSLVAPIYEGTSQIQSLMAMKDTLMAVLNNPQRFVRQAAQARWRSLSARDMLERRVAKLQVACNSALQHIIMRMLTEKVRGVGGQPLSDWPKVLRQKWDAKEDFAFALLHSERLTRMLTDTLVCEVLLEQSHKDKGRAEILERYIERAEPRSRAMLDEIQTVGERLLHTLRDRQGHANARAKSA